jgi:TetR/AcrR family transcriptional regulator, cholesterol catabolism regulator
LIAGWLTGLDRVSYRRWDHFRRAGYGGGISTITPQSSSSPTDKPEPDAPVGLRERNKAEKWSRILAAASRLFATQGFDATTTAAIAEEAGIGTGTLYLYVTSKEDLLVAVFRDEVGKLWDVAFAQVDPSAPLVDQLMDTFRHVTDYHEQEPELARIYFKELMFVSPGMRGGVSDFMRHFFVELTGLFDRAKERGQLHPDVPSSILAHNLWAQWYLLMQRRYAGTLDEAMVLASLERGIRVALWGISPASADPVR